MTSTWASSATRPDPVDEQHRWAELRRVRGRGARRWLLSLAAGRDGVLSRSAPDFTVPYGAGLAEAIGAAEVFLTRRMLIPAVGWQVADRRAAAALVPVTVMPAWRGVSWVCTVAHWPDPRGSRAWCLERQLSTEFEPLRHPLGTAGMDLARAVHTAQEYLDRDGWTLAGQWARSRRVAVVHAYPPAQPIVARPAPAAAGPTPAGGLVRPPASRQPAAVPAVVG